MKEWNVNESSLVRISDCTSCMSHVACDIENSFIFLYNNKFHIRKSKAIGFFSLFFVHVTANNLFERTMQKNFHQLRISIAKYIDKNISDASLAI